MMQMHTSAMDINTGNSVPLCRRCKVQGTRVFGKLNDSYQAIIQRTNVLTSIIELLPPIYGTIPTAVDG